MVVVENSEYVAQVNIENLKKKLFFLLSNTISNTDFCLSIG